MELMRGDETPYVAIATYMTITGRTKHGCCNRRLGLDTSETEPVQAMKTTAILHLPLHSGRLADTFIQRGLQYVHCVPSTNHH